MTEVSGHRIAPWSVYLAGAWAVVTVLFWVLNPSATQGLGPVERLVFWGAHTGIPLAILQLTQSNLTRWSWVTRQPNVFQIALGGLLGALIFVPIAAGLDAVFPNPDGGMARTVFSDLLSEAEIVVPSVVLVWIAVNGPRLIAPQGQTVEAADHPRPGFWQKTPVELGDDLVSITAELHYIRLRTSRGEALVLYPFGKAVEDLSRANGLQVHRSHWVALPHITEVERQREQARITLSTGDFVPVSRKFRPDLFDRLKAIGAARVIRA